MSPLLAQSGHGCGPARVRRTAQFSIQKCDSLLIPDLVLGAGEAMRRREFIRLFSSTVVAWPLAARAQQPAMRLIGILSPDTPASPFVEALRVGLQELGYGDGRNVRYEYRWAEGNFERLPDLAVELVGLNVDVIVAFVTAASLAARKATAMIPIVMAFVSDPIGAGLIVSLAHRGAMSPELPV